MSVTGGGRTTSVILNETCIERYLFGKACAISHL